MFAHVGSAFAAFIKGILRRLPRRATEMSKLSNGGDTQRLWTDASSERARIEGFPAQIRYWNWSGQYIGYRAQEALFLVNGRQCGYFAEGDEVYACSGEYLGEVRGANRLITNLDKKTWKRTIANPQQLKSASACHNISAKEMLLGYEDFPL